MELWKFPVSATALMKGPDFLDLGGRRCELSFHVEEEETGALTRIGLLFEGVESYKCTYLASISAEMFGTAYAKLVRLEGTPWLTELLKVDRKGWPLTKELQHLMICFDDGPCYEIACLGFVEQKQEQPG